MYISMHVWKNERETDRKIERKWLQTFPSRRGDIKMPKAHPLEWGRVTGI